MKKTNKVKHYIKAPRMVYTKSIKQLHLDFLNENPNTTCSRSTFIKYRPFYIEEATEREKQSCLCIICQNAHTKLAGINNFRKMEKLKPILSVTEYLKSQKAETLDHASYPERTSKKSVNYYVFETVLETYVKQGKTRSYTRTTRVDKNKAVSDLYSHFISNGERYLYHRRVVDNINSKLPKIRVSFPGKYLEMDPSQNISLKTKNEVQTAHFSGKQQSLHCSILIDENDALSYVHHLCDDTGHEPTFVDEMLNYIFFR